MKKEKIIELLVDDILNEELGVEIMSLVDDPAIGYGWVAFNENKDINDIILEMAADENIGEVYDPENVIYIDITKEKFNKIGDFLRGVVALDILGRRVNKKDGLERKYKYSGPVAERNFCKAMLNLNKLYTKEEIDQMSNKINTGFRHKGQVYSIFDFKGGVNCKHFWEELDVFRNDDGVLVMISHGRVEGRPGEVAGPENNFWRFKNIDEEQRIVVGPFMIPDLMIKRKDPVTNEIFYAFISEETIKNVAEKFLKENKHNNTDINHSDIINNKNTLLESWFIEDPEFDKSRLYGFENLPKGTWFGSYRINDDETWEKIKNKELTGFSITGNFKLR